MKQVASKASNVKGLEDKSAEFGQLKRRFFFRSHRGRHGRLVAVDWLASIQYTESNRSVRQGEKEPVFDSPTMLLFLADCANELERRRKMHHRYTAVYRNEGLQPPHRSIKMMEETLSVSSIIFVLCKPRKGKSGSRKEDVDTRPYTEKRCYSCYAKNPRTIAVIREKEREREKRNLSKDRRNVEQSMEKRAGKRTKRTKKKEEEEEKCCIKTTLDNDKETHGCRREKQERG